VRLAAAQERPAYAFNKDRNQYHSAAILRHLAQRHRAAAPVLGVTDVDLFVPDGPFVFGDADRGEGVALLSIARLSHGPDGKPVDPERLARRVQAEAVHGVGHLVGLSHCHDLHCAMLLSHRPSDADRKGADLCLACRSAAGLS
jgi:archaemetzincin